MKTTTKLLSLVLAVMLIAGTLAIGISADAAPAVWDGTADTSWYDADSASKTATLTTAAQLAGFANLCTAGNNFVGWTINLGADIVLNTGNASDWAKGTSTPANEWTPIKEFWGTFDGKGHKISGMYINEPSVERVGFFAALNGAKVQNVSFENACVIGNRQVGTVAGITITVLSEITNVYSDAYVYAYPCYTAKVEQAQVGGILGANATPYSTISKCHFDGEVYGVADPHVELQPGVNDGSAGSSSSDYWRNDNMAVAAGGITGFTNSQMEITDCLVTAKVVAHSQHGGIIGRVPTGANNTLLKNCLVIVEITATRYSGNNVFTGEFVGITMSGSKIKVDNCYGLNSYTATAVPDTTPFVGGANSVFGPHGGGGFTTDSTYSRVDLDNLKGDSAKTTLAGFDFDNVWQTVDGKTPVIRMSVLSTDEGNGDGGNADDGANAGNNNSGNNDNNNNADNTPATDSGDETTAPADNGGEATTAEEKTEEKSGCKSSVTVAAFSVLAVAACGTAVLGKKKKHN